MTQVPKEIMDLEKKENQNLVQKKDHDIRRSSPFMAPKFDPLGQFMGQPFPANSPFGMPPYQAQWPQFMAAPAYDFMGQGMSFPMASSWGPMKSF